MSYARRHSTNVCPGNRVRYTRRSRSPPQVETFFRIVSMGEYAGADELSGRQSLISGGKWYPW